ncbi:hypothetical protein DFH09DRAFT_1074663 [Mycena vulgaris]|nr:hypothetical protein DFH09DRAFT_1074663 [Mycena vulgaris]
MPYDQGCGALYDLWSRKQAVKERSSSIVEALNRCQAWDPIDHPRNRQLITVVDDGFLFQLPRIRGYHARVVALNGRRWMIWSANSKQNPFYSGPKVYMGLPPMSAEPEQRCYDGQSGRWDYVKVAQSLNATRPWLAFIIREGKHDEQDVEYTPVYSVWITTSAHKTGHLDVAYAKALVDRSDELDRQMLSLLPAVLKSRLNLCPYRPRFPARTNVEGVASVVLYERAVDQLAEIQRGMREKRAWITFAQKWIASPPPIIPSPGADIIPANDDFIGVWINGAAREDVHWFLTEARAPCFIIHELPVETPVENVLNSFRDDTDVPNPNDHQAYEYDRLAMAEVYRYTRVEDNPLPAVPQPRTLQERSWSSLHWQLGVPVTTALPLSVPHANSADPVESMDVDNTAASSIAVPPVAPPAGGGAWIVFRESEIDDEPVMAEVGGRRKGKAEMSEDEELWYDRRLKRKLIFTDLPPPPSGFTVDEEYGRPVPGWPFGYPSNGKFLPRKVSVWMYKKELPHPDAVGRIPGNPDPPVIAADDADRATSPPASLLPVAPRPTPPAVVAAPVALRTITPDVEIVQTVESSLGDDDIAPNVPSSPARSEGEVSLGPETEEDDPSRRGNSPPASFNKDVPMRSPSLSPLPLVQPAPAHSPSTDFKAREPSRQQAVPLVRDYDGRTPTRYVRVRGLHALHTTTMLDNWMASILVNGSGLDPLRVFRLRIGAVTEYVVELGSELEAQALMAGTISNLMEPARIPSASPPATSPALAGTSFMDPRSIWPRAVTETREIPLARRAPSTELLGSVSFERNPPVQLLGTSTFTPETIAIPTRDAVPIALSSTTLVPLAVTATPSTSAALALTASPSSLASPLISPAAACSTSLSLGNENEFPPPGGTISFPRRLDFARSDGEPRRPLESRLTDDAKAAEKALLLRLRVGLDERIGQVKPQRRRKHNRSAKRLNKIIEDAESLALPRLPVIPAFEWRDEDIDWFIDDEAGLPPPDDAYEPFGDFYDTDDE